MSRSSFLLLPAVLLVAACNSSGDNQSQTDMLPVEDETMAPIDMSVPDTGSMPADGSVTTGTASPNVVASPDGSVADPSANTSIGPAATNGTTGNSGTAQTSR